MIKHITVENFKSFGKLDVSLKPFNVIIGANASGKSNFVQIFSFLRDIAKVGLDNALWNTHLEDFKYLLNVNIGNEKNLVINVDTTKEFENEYPNLSPDNLGQILLRIKKQFYNLELNLNSNNEFSIKKDELKLFLNYNEFKYVFDENARDFHVEESPARSEDMQILYSNIRGRINTETKPDNIKSIPAFEGILLAPDVSILQLQEYNILYPTGIFYKNVFVADFNIKSIKLPSNHKVKENIDEYALNLAFVVEEILKDKVLKDRFISLISEFLPFITNVETKRIANKSVLLNFKEKYNDEIIPSFLLSDGTIYLTSLIVLLYFSDYPVIILEDFDKTIHPLLISKVVNMLKDASRDRQIIVTTHNPEVLKYVELSDILLSSRDIDGFSSITEAIDREDVRIFLENHIGISDMFIDGILR